MERKSSGKRDSFLSQTKDKKDTKTSAKVCFFPKVLNCVLLISSFCICWSFSSDKSHIWARPKVGQKSGSHPQGWQGLGDITHELLSPALYVSEGSWVGSGLV